MFELSKEHEDFRGVVREFALAEVAPHVEEWDEQHRFPVELVPKMGDLGLFGLVVPEEFGGADADFTSLCVAIEELGRVDQSIGITLSAGVGLGINPILTFGTAGAEGALAARPRRRPRAGRLRPDRARGGVRRAAPRGPGRCSDGDSWVVDGAKAFITNSGTAITQRGHRDRPHRRAGADGRPEISTILIPAGTPGLTVEPAYRKLGWHASDTHGLSFAGCRVPADNLLGERGRGLLAVPRDPRRRPDRDQRPRASASPRPASTPASSTRGSRQAFGRPIGVNQGVSFPIADLAVAVEAAGC